MNIFSVIKRVLAFQNNGLKCVTKVASASVMGAATSLPSIKDLIAQGNPPRRLRLIFVNGGFFIRLKTRTA